MATPRGRCRLPGWWRGRRPAGYHVRLPISPSPVNSSVDDKHLQTASEGRYLGRALEAQRIAIRAGLASRSATILAQGEDPETTDAEYAADFERADRLGLVFDSDPRMRDSAGNVTDNQEHTNDES